MIRIVATLALVLFALVAPAGPAAAQAPPIENELHLITPVSKFIHDAALKAFADYAKEKWNVTVKVSAIPAGTPVAYGRITEWKGRPEVDIFWGPVERHGTTSVYVYDPDGVHVELRIEKE